MKLHHIGMACRDMEKAIAQLSAFGYVSSNMMDDKNQKVKVCFMKHIFNPTIELVSRGGGTIPLQ